MLILRPEQFGGIAFNTAVGTKMFLDRSGYSTLQNFITKKTYSADTELFLHSLLDQLELNKTQDFIIRRQPTPEMPTYPFTVLSAPLLVDLQITNKCNLRCPHCYAGSSALGEHATFKNISRVLDQCRAAGVLEVALGGGEPTIHPQFTQILSAARKRNLVPNLATNGTTTNTRLVELFKKYCGAVALSVEFVGQEFESRRGYSFKKFLESAKLITAARVRLVFQLTVSSYNVRKIENVVNQLKQFKPYGFVFLTFKPVGRGKHFDSPLAALPSATLLKPLRRCFDMLTKAGIKIGYDCCMANLLADLNTTNGPMQGCSATRESIAVNANLHVSPCSFTTNISLGDLKTDTLLDIWHNAQSQQFRQRIESHIGKSTPCGTCPFAATCVGGCPVFKLVPCPRIEKMARQ